ncbi:MAG: phosphoadenosine phosphosulfate reductase family protein [Desmonostoc geniculatum HA4340-LM1]|jgi:3'-phosphoadenosine 5'-phosphosulfate sulfotransferase (PAPS reductase)/FAD synthetase|nr:phosphoadenosine phosphosulfate reductase family protein [Desmonostoc geniculatum HA4340-LM1]
MDNVVFFSGGVSSALTALYVKKCIPGRLFLLFTDTLTEDEDLYRFLDESIDAIKPDGVTHITTGMNVWDAYYKAKYLGNSRIDPCSRMLKREPAKKWIEERYLPENTTLFFGIHWSEEERLSAIKDNWRPYAVRSPMCEFESMYIAGNEIKDIWLRLTNVRIPRLYDMGFTHNNCGGFCCKAGKTHFRRLLEQLPDRYNYHAQKEIEIRRIVGNRTILREQKNGRKFMLSLEEFAKREKSQDETECISCQCFGWFSTPEQHFMGEDTCIQFR